MKITSFLILIFVFVTILTSPISFAVEVKSSIKDAETASRGGKSIATAVESKKEEPVVVEVSTKKGDGKDEEKTARKKATGEVMGVGYLSINVETSRENGVSQELLIPHSKDTKVRGYRSVKDFKRGDTVQVTYKQTYKEVPDSDPIILKTVAEEISLIKSGASSSQLTSRG